MARTVLLHVGIAMLLRRHLTASLSARPRASRAVSPTSRLVVGLTAAFLVALPAAAHAGSYVSGGLGTSPDVGGDVSVMLDTEGHNTGRLVLGQKIGPAAIEGGLSGFHIDTGTAVTASVALKLQTQISGALGLFARGSLDHTWVSADTMELDGTGHTLGLGLDYGVSALADGGLWLELDRQYLDLDGSKGTADTVMLGLRFGL